MNHDRLMVACRPRRYRQFKPFRIVEVDLHGGTLPGPTEDILDLDVDLRAVEDAFAGIHLMSHVAALGAASKALVATVQFSSGADGFSGRVER